MERKGNEKYTNASLALDQDGKVLQVASYDTKNAENLDGTSASDISNEFTSNTIVRLKSYDNDNWINISNDNSPAVSEQGMLLQNGEELTVLIKKNYKVATIGGKLNIVKVIG